MELVAPPVVMSVIMFSIVLFTIITRGKPQKRHLQAISSFIAAVFIMPFLFMAGLVGYLLLKTLSSYVFF